MRNQMTSGAGIIVNRKKVWELLSLEVYKYQIYTSGGGWQVKKGQVQLCNNKRVRETEREGMWNYLWEEHFSFLSEKILIMLFIGQLLNVVGEICLGLYTATVYLILFAKALKTQRLGPPWQCGRVQSISSTTLPRAPQQSLKPHPASIYAQTELYALWLIFLTSCGFHSSTQNQTQTYVFLGSGPT